MKLLIGLTLLSVALATQPIQLPEAALPAFEEIEPKAELPIMFQVPDISPALISPELSRMLNDLGEIRQEFVNNQFDDAALSPVQFVDHADVPEAGIIFETPDISPAFISPEISSMLNELGEIPVEFLNLPDLNEAENEVSPVLVANILPVAEDVDGVKFVDAPFEDEYDSAGIDPVQIADAPYEEAVPLADALPEAENVDAVQFVDGPFDAENTGAAVDSVLIADVPLEEAVSFTDVLPEIQTIDAVQFVDAPLEAEKDASAADSVLIADVPLEEAVSADSPAPSNLNRLIGKLLANRKA